MFSFNDYIDSKLDISTSIFEVCVIYFKSIFALNDMIKMHQFDLNPCQLFD